MSFPAYERYKDSGVEWLGQVPNHWTRTKLSRLVDPRRPITYGIVQAGPDVVDGVPYVRPADMTDEQGVLDEGRLLRTAPEIAKQYARSTVRGGDLICSIGPSFGKLMEVPESLDGANLTQGTARIAVVGGVLARFVFWLLRSEQTYAQWEASIGGATFRALNLEPLAGTQVAIPSLVEQRAIAAFLDRETAKIDALVEAQRRLIELLKEKRQAVISHAVTKGLDPSVPMKDSGVEWLGPVPAHWEVLPARHAFVERDERSPTGEETLLTVSHLTGVTPRSEKSVNMFKAETTEGYKQCYAGDLVINTLWAWMGAMGVAWQPGIVSPAYNVYTSRANYEPTYVNAVVRMPAFARETERFSKGVWSSRLRLYPAEFFRIVLPIPPMDEQVAIAKSLERYSVEYEALASEAEQAIALLQERRAALISAAVTGKIDVRGLFQAAEAA